MTRWLRSFHTDGRGAAAVELALVTPIIVGIILSSYALWEAASRRQDERSALDAGAQYYMNGGADDSVASALVQSAWQRRPADSSITIERNCMCATTPLACSSLCSDGGAPSAYVQLQVTANSPTALMSPILFESRVVRVR